MIFSLFMLLMGVTYALSIGALQPHARRLSVQSIRLDSVSEPSIESTLGDGDSTRNVVEYCENKGGDRAYGKRRFMQWDQESHMFAIFPTQVNKRGIKKKL